MEGINAIRTGKLISLSEQQLMDCDSGVYNNACEGGLAEPAFIFIKKHGGIASDESYPYTGKKEACDKAKVCNIHSEADRHEISHIFSLLSHFSSVY